MYGFGGDGNTVSYRNGIRVPSSPGAGVIVKIRGTGSILSNNNPLILVDGFPGSLDNLDVNDMLIRCLLLV